MNTRELLAKAKNLVDARFRDRGFTYRPKQIRTNEHELDLLALASALTHLITAAERLDARDQH